MFVAQEIIQDDRDERRWQILRPEPRHLLGEYPLSFWSVRDLRLQRDLSMLGLNYARIPKDRLAWDIPVLHQCFSRLVKLISQNCNAFPEAIDWVSCTKHRSLSSVPEPFFVFSPVQGRGISPLKSDEPDREKKVERLCKSVANLLRDIHQNGAVLRALPLRGLRRNPANQVIQIASFYTLQSIADFQGFNPYEAGFHPSPRYAAPECFASSSTLTPATDVYALGCLLLEYLGVALPEHPIPPNELDALCLSLNLSPWWQRFFKLALHEVPEARFQGMSEVLAYVLSRGQPTPRQNTHARQAPTPHAPRTKRPDAPPAALLIWGEQLQPKDQRFDIHKLLRDLQARYSLGPLLYFALEQNNMDNPYFQLLRKLSFQIVPYRFRDSISSFLQDASRQWSPTPRHLIVGNLDQSGIQTLIKIAEQSRVHFEVFSTGGRPLAHQGKAVDARSYLQQKTSF